MTVTITDPAPKKGEPIDDTLHRLTEDSKIPRGPPGHSWFAIKAKPMGEGRLVRGLQRMKLDTYRPMSTHFLRKRSGKVKIKRPLFAGYVFVCCGIEHFDDIFKLDGYGHFVRCSGSDLYFKFPDMKIGDLMMRQRFGEFDDPTPKEGKYKPQKGDRVLVVAGKWYGYFAEVLGLVSKKNRAKVQFDLGGAPQEVEFTQLTPEAV